jgi:hypothetical protein
VNPSVEQSHSPWADGQTATMLEQLVLVYAWSLEGEGDNEGIWRRKTSSSERIRMGMVKKSPYFSAVVEVVEVSHTMTPSQSLMCPRAKEGSSLGIYLQSALACYSEGELRLYIPGIHDSVIIAIRRGSGIDLASTGCAVAVSIKTIDSQASAKLFISLDLNKSDCW